MFETLTLKFTERPDLKVSVAGITILVGPNNSGKSLFLREVEQVATVHPFPKDLSLIRDFEIVWPTQQSASAELAKLSHFKQANSPPGHEALGRMSPNGNVEVHFVNEQHLHQIIAAKTEKSWIATQFLRWGLIRLDGRSRFALTNDQGGGDLVGPTTNILQHIFKSDDVRQKIRMHVYDAFKLYFVVDPTNLGTLRIRNCSSPLSGDALRDNPPPHRLA